MSQFCLVEKKLLLDYSEAEISLKQQCELVDLNRSTAYYKAAEPSEYEVETKNLIDRIYTKHPIYGSRRITITLRTAYNKIVNRKRIQNYMQQMGIEGIHPRRNLSKSSLKNRIYPYLLKNLTLKGPRHVYSTDITYIGLKKGWLYLVAVIDWYSRYVVSWELDQSLEVEFVKNAVKQSILVGKPEIFNSDQGSQFTSVEYINILKEEKIAISMDHKGRAFDNIFIERFWRSLKYEKIYLDEFESPRELRRAIKEYLDFYNFERPHQSLGYQTPASIYYKN